MTATGLEPDGARVSPGDQEAISQTTVAEQIASILVRNGVGCIFGQSIPTELLLAAERMGVRQLLYRTENAGGAMADGYARAARKLGIVTAQNGPAATLLVPPLSEALKASIPVIAMVQEVPRARRGRNAFQEVDHHALFAGCTKAVFTLDNPSTIEAELFRGLATAVQGRPGPVVVLLPREVLSQPSVEQPSREGIVGSFPLDRPRPDRDSVQRTAALLAAAKRPLVVAGGGVHLSGACAELAALQELAALPVATTTMGKGAVNERHELSLGVVGSFMGELSYNHNLRVFVDQADVILMVGTRTNENGTDVWTLFPDGASYAQLDIAPEELNRNYEGVRLLGDAKAGLADLAEELTRRDLSVRRAWRPTAARLIADARRQGQATARAVTRAKTTPIRPERVMAELDQLLRPGDVIVADASYSTVWIAAYLTARTSGQRFVSPRGLAGLGWGLPMAIGVKASEPEARVVCVVGDGAFGHVWSELETAVRESLPLTIILMRNDILGFQRHGEMHSYNEHTSATGFGPVDHTAVATACGAVGVRIESPDSLRDALATALDADYTTLLEVVVDSGAYPPFTKWDNSESLAKLRSEPALRD